MIVSLVHLDKMFPLRSWHVQNEQKHWVSARQWSWRNRDSDLNLPCSHDSSSILIESQYRASTFSFKPLFLSASSGQCRGCERNEFAFRCKADHVMSALCGFLFWLLRSDSPASWVLPHGVPKRSTWSFVSWKTKADRFVRVEFTCWPVKGNRFMQKAMWIPHEFCAS
jgi:hypothetical protein